MSHQCGDLIEHFYCSAKVETCSFWDDFEIRLKINGLSLTFNAYTTNGKDRWGTTLRDSSQFQDATIILGYEPKYRLSESNESIRPALLKQLPATETRS